MIHLNHRRLAAALLALPRALPMTLHAQTPIVKGPVKLLVRLPPDCNGDLSARILAPAVAKELGQPVVILNKAGASGTPGLDLAAKAAPDGTTIGIASRGNHLAAPSLHAKLRCDSTRASRPWA